MASSMPSICMSSSESGMISAWKVSWSGSLFISLFWELDDRLFLNETFDAWPQFTGLSGFRPASGWDLECACAFVPVLGFGGGCNCGFEASCDCGCGC